MHALLLLQHYTPSWSIICSYTCKDNSSTACSYNVYVTLSAKTHIIRTSMYIEKKKRNLTIICEIMHATGKYLQGASNQQRKLQINKKYTPSYSPAYGVFEKFSFISVAWTVSICLQCGRRKQNRYRFLSKTATIDKCAVFLLLTCLASHWSTF